MSAQQKTPVSSFLQITNVRFYLIRTNARRLCASGSLMEILLMELFQMIFSSTPKGRNILRSLSIRSSDATRQTRSTFRSTGDMTKRTGKMSNAKIPDTSSYAKTLIFCRTQMRSRNSLGSISRKIKEETCMILFILRLR